MVEKCVYGYFILFVKIFIKETRSLEGGSLVGRSLEDQSLEDQSLEDRRLEEQSLEGRLPQAEAQFHLVSPHPPQSDPLSMGCRRRVTLPRSHRF